MPARRVEIRARVSPERRAQVRAAARRLGLTETDFVAMRVLGPAAESDGLAAVVAQLTARIDALESSLADALDARDASLRDAIAEQFKAAGRVQTRNFTTLGDWLAKRLPRTRHRAPTAPVAAPAAEPGEPENDAAEALAAIPTGDEGDA